MVKVELDGFKSLGKYFSPMVLPTCVTKSLLFAYQIPSPHTVLWNGKDEKILLNPNFMTWSNKNCSWTKPDFFSLSFMKEFLIKNFSLWRKCWNNPYMFISLKIWDKTKVKSASMLSMRIENLTRNFRVAIITISIHSIFMPNNVLNCMEKLITFSVF